MRISHGTRIKQIKESNGYGYATANMLRSLRQLGHEVNPNDARADAEVWFDQPKWWEFSKGPYRIGYHPWESTKLKDGWAEIMNQCDEIWTPSPIIAKWYEEYAGIKVPVYTYEHGVDKVWTPMERPVSGKIRFLHVGGEALRKGAGDTMKAFRAAFPNNRDVELNMKIISKGWNLNGFNRVNIINGSVPLRTLIRTFHVNHVFVYPSYGEGFGLTPLQAMATGMPTITVPGWAPYADFLDPNLSIGSEFIDSPWPKEHPGKMLQPNFDDIVEAMRYAYENYDRLHAEALAKVPAVQYHYDWNRVTKDTFDGLAQRLQNA